MVQIVIEFDGKRLVLPVNPEKITPSRSASNTNIDLVGIGPATRKGHPGLSNFTIDSFFPGPKSYFYKGDTPSVCIAFINSIWRTENIDNKVAQLIVTGIPVPINMYFVIESFEYDHAAGQEEDIPFRLKVKEYIPYGSKKMAEDEVAQYFTSKDRVQSPTIATTDVGTTGSTYVYTVESGDCLYNITKACCDDPNKWGELYELNKDVIGGNPRLIKPGQQLKLPEGWNIPTSVAKLKNKVKKTDTGSAIDAYNTLNSATNIRSFDEAMASSSDKFTNNKVELPKSLSIKSQANESWVNQPSQRKLQPVTTPMRPLQP